jgi:hypothetical protein
MNPEKITGRIISVELHDMCEAVLSYVTVRFYDTKLKYYDKSMYSIIEEHGTIENLCAKYKIIIEENSGYDRSRLNGKKFKFCLKNGTNIFEGYC